MESGQLRNIQNIQNSLSLLKSKIDKLSKLQSKNQQAIDKLIFSTIPVVQKKLKQAETLQSIQLKKTHYKDKSYQIRKKNQQSRLVNEKEVARSKELLTLMKHHNSLHLKESKKHNQDKIKQMRELQLNQKKQKKNLIKKTEERSQAKIREFYDQKKSQLRLRRQYECKQNEQKASRLLLKMRQLARHEQQMQQRIRASEQNVHKFRDIVRKVDKMKGQQFVKFTQEISPTNKLSNSKSLSEAILMFAVKSNK